MSGDGKLPTGRPNAKDYFSGLFSLKLVWDRFYGPSQTIAQCVLCAHSTIYNALCNGPCVFLHRTRSAQIIIIIRVDCCVANGFEHDLKQGCTHFPENIDSISKLFASEP
jgi:hypothetical protein